MNQQAMQNAAQSAIDSTIHEYASVFFVMFLIILISQYPWRN